MCTRETDIETNCEIIWTKLKLARDKSTLIGSYYRPPTIDSLDQLQESILQAQRLHPSSTIYLGGDFNLASINWDTHSTTPGGNSTSQSQLLLDILTNTSIEQVNRHPTRNDNILDLFITSHPTLVTKTCTAPRLGDHDTLIIDLNTTPHIQKKPPRTVYSYHKANWDGITKDLQKFQELYFDRIPSNHTVEDNWNYIKEDINTTVSKNIPTKKISHKQHVPWITGNIIQLTRRKHRAYNTHKRTKKDSDWARFTSLRKRVHRELRASYWDYVDNLLDPEIDKSNKKFWRFIKARKQDNTGISTLRENGRIITDSQEKAEVLNNQFTSVFPREDTASMPDLPPTQYRPMNPITVTSKGRPI